MSDIELYNDNILDIVSVGKTINEFDESDGDYIKVEIFGPTSNISIGTFFSNRLLLKYSNADNYYIGEYHFHPENIDMGFCSGREHTTNSISNLKPITVGSSIDEPLNPQSSYKKQLDIFKDSSGRIYIKPNDIIKLLNVPRGKYRTKINFLRDIKSTLGMYLNQNKNNLIENGNFFAGLEATQTGDLDRSTGKNNFIKKNNPGFGSFILEQSGLPDNSYNMEITGIEPTSNYVFSCWVAWGEDYNGGKQIASFSSVSPQGGTIGLSPTLNTDLGGSYLNINDDSDRILETMEIDGINWEKRYAFVQTDNLATLGTILIHLGKNGNNNFNFSDNPLGIRYFTDLKFEKVLSLVGSVIQEYIIRIKK